MKAIISTTLDDKYQFFLPIIIWCWNKLGVDVICFSRSDWEFGSKDKNKARVAERGQFIAKTIANQGMKWKTEYFICPEHKEATYAQCSRLYAAGLPNLPDNEMLVTSDVDMAVFQKPFVHEGLFHVLGSDLVPEKQLPICYISAPASLWKKHLNLGDRSPQKCLDYLLEPIECTNFRGNQWSLDQDEAFRRIPSKLICKTTRAKEGTQFATKRVDRDDFHWRDHLGIDLWDAHLWRPGYTDENFANIMELLQTQYPSDNFDWLVQFRNEYIKLL